MNGTGFHGLMVGLLERIDVIYICNSVNVRPIRRSALGTAYLGVTRHLLLRDIAAEAALKNSETQNS